MCPGRLMRMGVGLVCLLGAQALCEPLEDTTIVETAQEEGTRLEDQPEVDELPGWMIDIPPEPQGAAQQPRQLLQFVEADEHVVSDSRMFSVSGGDALRMGAIAAHADELRARFNGMLGLEDKWKYAVSLRLVGNTADAARARPIRTQVRIIGHEPHLQIRVFGGGGINLARLDEAIITMLMYEYALRHVQAEALPDYLEMPPWLVCGLQQALLWRQGRVDRRLYQNLFSRGDMMAPQEVVNAAHPERMDASSRQLYEVSCGVLLMGLLNQKDGPDLLRNLLAESLTQEGSAAEVIASHFPGLYSQENSFSKWWALELAALSTPQVMETLTPLDSERLLREALLVTGVDKVTRVPFSVSVADLDGLLELPDWREQLPACTERLEELSRRCFPGYRAIIMEYYRAIGELLKGKKREEVRGMLADLKELREAYTEAATRGRDYLDWFEITQLGHTQGGNFDTYREAMRLLRREHPGPETPMSRYLDDIELLYGLKEGEPLPEQLRGSLERRVPRP